MREFLAIALVLAAACAGLALLRSGNGAPPPPAESTDASARRFLLTYAFTVSALPVGARRVRVWIPAPARNGWQEAGDPEWRPAYPFRVVTDAIYGNRFFYCEFDGREVVGRRKIPFQLSFEVQRRQAERLEAARLATPVSRETLRRFLDRDRLVPIDGPVAAEARAIAADTQDRRERARRVYDHVVTTLQYDKSGHGWGRGDALLACSTRRGNCTDFHSLLIGELRSLGVPARFVIGLPVPEGARKGTVPGYHCWAEFYLDGVGWVPVDASEASRHPERKEFLFGGLDASRVEFTTGRDIPLPGAASSPLNFVIYPHVEVDSREHDAVETHFSFRELPLIVNRAAHRASGARSESDHLGLTPEYGTDLTLLVEVMDRWLPSH